LNQLACHAILDPRRFDVTRPFNQELERRSASTSPFEVLRQLNGIGTKGGGYRLTATLTSKKFFWGGRQRVAVKRLKPILF
jgi:hypothetical protein